MILQSASGEQQCFCKNQKHTTKLIVLTGGPGAGKTAVLELAKKEFCAHIGVLPESASLLFNGGFWRMKTVAAQKAAQRAIFKVQKEMESIVHSDSGWALGLCDRGSLDGFAYWPEIEDTYWKELNTSLQKEFENYAAVIHLRTPTQSFGYNFQNHLRTESAAEALAIDKRIELVWRNHPNYQVVTSDTHFSDKAKHTLSLIQSYIPSCCSEIKNGEKT